MPGGLARLAPPEYQPKTEADKQALLTEADFAFRQAFALCPYSPEAIFRYVQLLLQFNRLDDAQLIAEDLPEGGPGEQPGAGPVGESQELQAPTRSCRRSHE